MNNKLYNAITDFAVEWKPILGLVFSAMVFLWVVADLAFFHRGSVSTLLLLQFFLLSLVGSLLQVFLLGSRFVLLDWSLRRLTVLHYLLTAGSFLGMMLLFGWFPLTFSAVLIFLGVFTFVYFWLYIAFSVFRQAQQRHLNESLAQFKEKSGAR